MVDPVGVPRPRLEPKVTFEALVSEMVQADLDAAKRDDLVKRHGYRAFDYHEGGRIYFNE